ncbi:DUF1542 domain-containing protein, partial [Lactobacillus sp. XV13L]|nr:DUF1542 domain-containing protein [Lactobacillus sp. XV13L]
AVSTAETAFEKLTAKDAVQAEATKIKAGLSNPADQKAVDDLVTEANKDIDAATSVAAVDQIRDKAIADIDSVKTAADDTAVKGLKDAQAKALNELHDEQVKVKGTIDGLPNISDSAKIALKAKVDAAYKTAADKVEAAQTLSDVDTAKTNGLKAMDDVLNEAKDLSATIAADQKKLDDAAQAAVDRINKSDMADEDKQKAIGAITAARNAAKENVGKQTTETAANDATTAGEAAITAAETTANQADLDEAKTANKAALDEAVKAAKGRLTA